MRGMSSRFVMGGNQIHVAYFIQTHSVYVSYMHSNLKCSLFSVRYEDGSMYTHGYARSP